MTLKEGMDHGVRIGVLTFGLVVGLREGTNSLLIYLGFLIIYLNLISRK